MSKPAPFITNIRGYPTDWPPDLPTHAVEWRQAFPGITQRRRCTAWGPLEDLEQLAQAILAYVKQQREAANIGGHYCPQCHGPLEPVCYAGGYLNRDQWEAQRAGDWFCRACPPNDRSARNQYCYWWQREVEQAQQQREVQP